MGSDRRRAIMTTATFSEEEFWTSFTQDLQLARAHLIIQSPFISAKRVAILSQSLRALTNKGVVICVFAQEPRGLADTANAPDPEIICSVHQWRSVIEMLESMGIHVNVRKHIHAKFAVVDDKVLWEGSLNILSHSNTKEHMRRWQSQKEIRAIVEKNSLADCSKCTANHVRFGMGAKGLPRLAVMGALLKRYRNRQPLSQTDLAKRSRLRQARLSEIEGGKNITLDTFFAITEGLGVEPVIVPELLIPAVTEFLNNAMGDDETPQRMTTSTIRRLANEKRRYTSERK